MAESQTNIHNRIKIITIDIQHSPRHCTPKRMCLNVHETFPPIKSLSIQLPPKTEAEIKIPEGTIVVSRCRRATSCTERQKQGKVKPWGILLHDSSEVSVRGFTPYYDRRLRTVNFRFCVDFFVKLSVLFHSSIIHQGVLTQWIMHSAKKRRSPPHFFTKMVSDVEMRFG